MIGLDIHQAQITACALIEEPDGSMRIEQRQFGRPHYNGVSRLVAGGCHKEIAAMSG